MRGARCTRQQEGLSLIIHRERLGLA